MRMNHLWTLILALPLCIQCAHQTAPKSPPASNVAATIPNGDEGALRALSEQDANLRSGRVSDLHYNLFFRLTGNEPDFTGEVTIKFQLSDNSAPLRIDFAKGQVTQLQVNHQTSAVAYNGYFLMIDPKSLVVGQNAVTIRFTHPYSQTGAGLYRMKDLQDGHSYVYSNFEPFDAHRLFPCFDQPDLKADYKLQVEAPSSWTVISSTLENSVSGKGTQKLWSFPVSSPISTYVFALHAGPYAVWRGRAGAIPLRLFARKSMAKYVAPVEWLKVTAQGLEFYQKYFGYAYPFKKYDQVLVPDFNAGAMENVAAVTFSEHLIQRGKSTVEQKYDRASTILHEMAHMWFGDLVTMKWWNDLWLNESFASYMSQVALYGGTEYKQAWVDFADTKQWAYREDQFVTTHPIETHVASTDQAFTNFDGITYGKGASVLQQLSHYLGADKFQKGVQLYFKRYAFKNARRSDFIGALSEVSGVNLSAWTQEWLQTAGVNGLTVHYDCAADKISQFTIVQTASVEHPELRTHRSKMGLYKENNGALTLLSSVPVTYSGASTSPAELIGQPCPDLVYPNDGDFDYAKVALGRHSLDTAKRTLAKIQDPLLRTMIWEALWNMVRDAQLSIVQYAEIAMNNVVQETDFRIASDVLSNLSSTVLVYLPYQTPEQVAFRHTYVTRLENFFWQNLGKAEAGSDFQKLWFDNWVSITESETGLRRQADFLGGKVTLPGFVLDQDRRWQVIRHLNAYGYREGEALRVEEFKKDSSSDGQNRSITAEASQPNLEIKKKWFARIIDENNGLSLEQRRSALRGLFPPNQDNLRVQFTNPYYAQILKSDGKSEEEFTTNFVRYLVPVACDAATSQRVGEFLAANPQLSVVETKPLRIFKQEDERCQRIRQMAMQKF